VKFKKEKLTNEALLAFSLFNLSAVKQNKAPKCHADLIQKNNNKLDGCPLS